MSQEKYFTHENVIITGGATGIGFALAKKLVADGNKVTICGRRMDMLEKAQSDCPGLNIFQADITNVTQQNKLFDIAEQYGPVTMLINNAAIISLTASYPEKGTSDDEIRNLFEINCIAPLQLTRRMVERGKKGGRIIQIGSLAAIVPLEAQAIYAGTKAGLKHTSNCLFRPLKRLGFHLIHVQPPSTQTPMIEDMHVPGMDPDILADRILKGAKKNKAEIRPHFDNYLSELGSRFAPWLLLRMANARYKHLK